MTTISLHYWAGARAAAEVASEEIEADSVADALAAAVARRAGDARFARVLSVCSVLIDGVVASAADLDRTRTGHVQAEVLPPFAGGSCLSK